MSGFPGNPAAVSSAAGVLGVLAPASGSAATTLSQAANQAAQVWTGEGASAFTGVNAVVGTHLSQSQQAYEVSASLTNGLMRSWGQGNQRYDSANRKQQQLTTELQKAQQSLAAKQAELTKLSATLASNEKALATAQTQHASVGNPGGIDAEIALQAAASLLQPLRAAITQTQGQIAHVQQEIARIRSQIQQLDAEIQAQEQIKATLTTEANQAATQYAAQMGEAEKMFPQLQPPASAGGGGGVLDGISGFFGGAVHMGEHIISSDAKFVGQIGSGLWSDAKGLGQLALLAGKMSPGYALLNPSGSANAYKQFFRMVKNVVTHPVGTASALVDLKDLKKGNLGHWLGVMAPVLLSAGTGALVKASRLAKVGNVGPFARAAGSASLSKAAELPYKLAALEPAPTKVVTFPAGKMVLRGAKRPPEIIFKEGFQPRGTDNNLVAHVYGNPKSNYVPATTDPLVADSFPHSQRFIPHPVYEIVSPSGGVDVAATLGPTNPFPGEQEIAFPGGIPTQSIKGARMPDGTWVPNPSFVP